MPVRGRRRAPGLPAGWIQRAAREALAAEEAPPCEVSVLLTDDPRIQRLNREFRGIDAPTDVLSFPQWELQPGAARALPPASPLGDVVISMDTARTQAEARGVPLAEVLAHLVVHGVLHLLGWDHATRAQERAMRARESGVLEGLGMRPVLWPDRARKGGLPDGRR